MHDLESSLSAFRDAPVGALPGAAAARARGAQRTRRTRAALAAAGSVAVVLAVTTGTALSGGGRDRVETPAGPTPSAAPVETGLTASLLDPDDLATTRPGPWAVRPTDDLPFDPLPAGCAEATEVFGDPVQTGLRFLDGPAPYVAGHSLKAYGDETEAEAAYRRAIDGIEACGEAAPSYQLHGGLPGADPSRTYGSVSSGEDTVGFAIERIGAVVSGVAIRSLELSDIPPLADAAAAEVRGGAFAAPAPTDAAAPPAPPQTAAAEAESALLRPQDVGRVEDGAWTVEPAPRIRLLDPCAGGTAYPTDEQVEARASTLLIVRREAGGTDVAQEVHRYSSAAAAVEAVGGYQRAVEGCPTEPSERSDGVTTRHAVVDGPGDVLYVRQTGECDGCLPYPSYFAVVRQGALVSVLSIAIGEDGDPGVEFVAAYADAARARLAQVS